MSTKVRNKFITIEDEMNDFFIERAPVVRGLLVALLSGENIVFIGPPGTAKSMMVKNLAERIITDTDEDYFEWLMTKFTKPEEILGPMIVDDLVHGIVNFKTDYKLPKATIAYLDEIFKGNSSILNCLLSALNEKVVYTGNKPVPIPLKMCVGTSNEIPTDESLKALYDRFRIRYETNYIREPKNLLRLIDTSSESLRSEGKISLKELNAAQDQIKNTIKFPEEKQKLFCKIIYDLENAGGLRPSDRTINNASKILKTEAWMNGNLDVTDSDMEFLENVFWDDPSRRKEVRSIIFSVINPIGEQIIETYERCQQAYLEFLKNIKEEANKDDQYKIITGTTETMDTLKKGMLKDIEAMKKEGRPIAKYKSLVEAVNMIIGEIITDYVGIAPKSKRS